MYNHPGRKIKTLAMVLLVIYFLIGALVGFLLEATIVTALGEVDGLNKLVSAQSLVVLCPVVGGLLGLLIGWINTILLYAFGTLVEETQTIRTEMMGLCLDVAELRKKQRTLSSQNTSNTPPEIIITSSEP